MLLALSDPVEFVLRLGVGNDVFAVQSDAVCEALYNIGFIAAEEGDFGGFLQGMN